MCVRYPPEILRSGYDIPMYRTVKPGANNPSTFVYTARHVAEARRKVKPVARPVSRSLSSFSLFVFI